MENIEREYRESKDCVVLMNPLVKTFAPFNGQDCTRNGFMARDIAQALVAKARSLLVKYDAYLLIRSKSYPHYLVRFLVCASISRHDGLLLFSCLTAIEVVLTNWRHICNEIGNDTDNYRVAMHSHADLHRNDICLEHLVPICLLCIYDVLQEICSFVP